MNKVACKCKKDTIKDICPIKNEMGFKFITENWIM